MVARGLLDAGTGMSRRPRDCFGRYGGQLNRVTIPGRKPQARNGKSHDLVALTGWSSRVQVLLFEIGRHEEDI
jgi:hypothetical protein